MTHIDTLSTIAAYAGYITDTQELLSTTSGGIATALSRKMVRCAGAVAGVAYSPDFSHARYEIATQESHLERFRGSKYIEVTKGSIYRDVEALLSRGTPVLFFGLPCAISALKQYLGGDFEQLLTVALICHGPTYAEVHRQYVAHLEQQYGSKIVDFSVRRKDAAWTPAYLWAKFADGQVFQQKFDDTEYGYAFRVLSKGGCYSCPFRSRSRQWDLTIGDYWGASETDPFWNSNGVSAILAHTEKGLGFLKDTPEIQLFETSIQKIVDGNPCLVSPRQPKPQREAFLSLMKSHGLIYASHHVK